MGIEVHELPNLSQKYRQNSSQFSCYRRPGIYLPGNLGSLEDMAIVKKMQNITKSSKASHNLA